VSENAIRQRIKRGTLEATKVDGIWRVHISDHEGDQPIDYQHDYQTDHEPTTDDHEVDRQAIIMASARSQLEAIRDEWLLPLVERIGTLERENGQLIERDREQQEVIERITAEFSASVASRNQAEADREHAQRQAEIIALEREAVEAERDALLGAQDALRSRVQELETASAESSAKPENGAPEAVQRAWWRRWFGQGQ